MNKSILFFSVLLFCKSFFAQQIEWGIPQDTIRIGEYGLGEMDSAAVRLFGVLKNVPSGSFDNRPYLDNQFLNQHANLQLFNANFELQALRNSFLPHLSFNYSAGSKASQLLTFRFEQQLTKRWLLNIDVDQKSSNGFLVSSNYSDRAVKLGWRRSGQFFTNRTQLYSSQQTYHFNGGLLNDSSVLSLPLDYVDVRQNLTQNATANYRKVAIYTGNYFNFLKDSVNQFGFVTKHNYSVLNRRYNESNLIDTLYTQFNFDSTKTEDQFQIASIQNQVGIYQSSKHFSIDALLAHKYWNVQNKGVHRDTNEINLTSLLQLNWSKIGIKNAFDFNLFGAKNEWKNQALLYLKNNKHQANLQVEIGYRLPSPFIRSYQANNYSYQLKTLNLQQHTNAVFAYKYSITAKRLIEIKTGYIQLKNAYLFNDSIWAQSPKTIGNISLELRATWNIKALHLQMSYLMNSGLSSLQLLPKDVLSARLFLNGKAFKQKLGYQIGAELIKTGKYTLLNYNPVLDALYLNSTPTLKSFNAMMNIGVFGSISIQEFRFFFKVSNLGYFWNNKMNQELNGYPIQQNLLQFGLTWDFYN